MILTSSVNGNKLGTENFPQKIPSFFSLNKQLVMAKLDNIMGFADPCSLVGPQKRKVVEIFASLPQS